MRAGKKNETIGPDACCAEPGVELDAQAMRTNTRLRWSSLGEHREALCGEPTKPVVRILQLSTRAAQQHRFID